MDIAVVVPVCNEEKNIPVLVERLDRVLRDLVEEFKILFVTDENTDNTMDVLRIQCQQNPHVMALKLSRRNGQHLAIRAGLEQVQSKYYIIMDGDLQDLPEDIPRLYQKALEGYDLVYGVKRHKNMHWLRDALSKAFSAVMTKLSDVKMNTNTSMFRILSQKMVEEILRYGETDPSLNMIVSLINLPTAHVEVTSGVRMAGQTNYSFGRMLNLSINFILSFSTKPLRIMSMLGFMIAIVSFLIGIYSLVAKLILQQAPLGWATIVSGIFALGGVQIMSIGIVGEYVGKTFIQSKNRPLYTVEEKIGFHGSEASEVDPSGG